MSIKMDVLSNIENLDVLTKIPPDKKYARLRFFIKGNKKVQSNIFVSIVCLKMFLKLYFFAFSRIFSGPKNKFFDFCPRKVQTQLKELQDNIHPCHLNSTQVQKFQVYSESIFIPSF